MKSWAIRNLKKANIRTQSLVIIYCSLIRSAIEYAAPVYAHFLTGEQSQALERLQMQSLKTIFGFKHSYDHCLRLSGLQKLETRREKLVLKFAQKLAGNPMWNHWFPLQPECPHNLRRTRTYREEFASKERLKNSPIFAMRRLLNNQL